MEDSLLYKFYIKEMFGVEWVDPKSNQKQGVNITPKEIGAIIGVGTVSVAALTALGAYVFKKYRAKYDKKTPTDTKQEINPENDFSVDIEGKSLI